MEIKDLDKRLNDITERLDKMMKVDKPSSPEVKVEPNLDELKKQILAEMRKDEIKVEDDTRKQLMLSAEENKKLSLEKAEMEKAYMESLKGI